MVDSITKLDRYRWRGHSAVSGRFKNDRQDKEYVLKWIGEKKAGEAKRAYRQFVKNGIAQGHRSDLIGGGLIRSQRGWSAVKDIMRQGIREKSDERILDSGEFVQQLIRQSDEERRKQFFN